MVADRSGCDGDSGCDNAYTNGALNDNNGLGVADGCVSMAAPIGKSVRWTGAADMAGGGGWGDCGVRAIGAADAGRCVADMLSVRCAIMLE